MAVAPPLPADVNAERRKNTELRGIVDFITQLTLETNRPSWDCILDTYTDLLSILRGGKDLTVSDDLLDSFETNKRVIEQIYNPKKKGVLTLAAPLKNYLQKLLNLKSTSYQSPSRTEDDDTVRERYDDFLRQYVIHMINDQRVVLLMLVSVLYHRLQNLSTNELRDFAGRLSGQLSALNAKPERTVTLLIYNLCQASVNAIDAADFAKGSLLCERAVELFKLIPKDTKVKGEIRGQIEDAMRITTERLVNRIQEKEQNEEVHIIEDIVQRLFNIDLIAYLLPQLVFFLIRAQRYEECLTYLDRILNASDISGDFMDYQTGITIGHYWCDSLLKAERYSRGQVNFSFIDREKDHIAKVFELSKTIKVPDMEDETFYNVEIEKLAVTFSHLGTLFFQTGRVELAAESYARSFDTILTKRCSRNRDSVDEILDRYKDTLYHPLNSAPMEAHALIGVYASEKGYDFLMEAQIRKFDRDKIPYRKDEQNFYTLVNPQKELISDLMDSTRNKLKQAFSSAFSAHKHFIVDHYNRVRDKMQIHQ